MDTIALLPLAQIIEALGPRDRARAAQVCARWRDVVAAAKWPGWRIRALVSAYSVVCARGTAAAARRWAAQLGITRGDILAGGSSVLNGVIDGGPASSSPLDSAATNPDPEVMKWLVAEYSLGLSDFRRLEMRPVSVAAWGGNTTLVSWLMDTLQPAGADIYGTANLFMCVCHHPNNRELLGRLIATYGRTEHDVVAELEALRAACDGGNALWLIEALEIPEGMVFVQHCLYIRNLCKNGHLDDLKQLCSRYTIDCQRALGLFAQATCAGGLAAAQWLASRYGITPAAIRPMVPGIYMPLSDAILRGHVEMADWLRDDFGLNEPEDVDLDRILRHCCRRGDTAAVSWLAACYNIGPAIRAGAYRALEIAFAKGSLPLVKLLLECLPDLKCEDLRPLISFATYGACHELVVWLTDTFGLEAGDFTARSGEKFLLHHAACSGEVAMLRWAVDRFGYTAHDVRGEQCLWHAVSRGHTTAATWLADRFDIAAADIGAQMPMVLDQAASASEESFLWVLERFRPAEADVLRNGNCEIFHTVCSRGYLRAARELARRYPIPNFVIAAARTVAQDVGATDVENFLDAVVRDCAAGVAKLPWYAR